MTNIFDCFLVIIGLRRRREHITHQRAPEAEILVRSNKKAKEAPDDRGDATYQGQYLIQGQYEPDAMYLFPRLHDLALKNLRRSVTSCIVPSIIIFLVDRAICSQTS